jgi:hypothetical protein
MLLLKVAPQVELYVAKVFNDQSNVTKAHIAGDFMGCQSVGS